MIKKVLKQLQRNKLQSVFLFVPVFILSAILFGSVVIDTGLKEGTKNLEKRMGADLMIVPQGEKDLAGSIISEGARGTFYLNSSVYDIALKTKGVAAATPQFFLKSLAADCCSSEVEIVFYEPKTDFIIHPWISKEYGKQQDKNEVVRLMKRKAELSNYSAGSTRLLREWLRPAQALTALYILLSNLWKPS